MTLKSHRLIGALLAGLFSTAYADNQKHHFEIPPQALSTALQKFAAQSGTSMLYTENTTANKQSRKLNGDYTIAEAVDQLLKGSGLAFKIADNGTVTLTTQETIELKPMTVKAKVLDQTDPYDTDYSHTNASTATKTDTPIMETPFSVQVVPQQILKDQQAVNLQDATKNISGVQTNYGYGNLYQAFAIRGFETNNILRNGQRNGGGDGQR